LATIIIEDVLKRKIISVPEDLKKMINKYVLKDPVHQYLEKTNSTITLCWHGKQRKFFGKPRNFARETKAIQKNLKVQDRRNCKVKARHVWELSESAPD